MSIEEGQVAAASHACRVPKIEQKGQTESSGNFGDFVDNVTLTLLPIVGTRGRNPISLVTLIPGVVANGGNATGGGVSVNGSRDRAWNYTLDGVDVNETSSGGSTSSPLSAVGRLRAMATGTFSGSVQPPASCTGCNGHMGHIQLDPSTGILSFLTAAQKAQFYVPAAGQSNLGRNYFRQAGVWNVDATLSKNFTIVREQVLQLRLEAQNLANNNNYDTFGSQSIQSSLFGRLNAATDGVVSNGPRRMQLSAKYTF